MNAGIILFAAFAFCLIIGVPVSISLGAASLCSVVFGGLSASSTVIAQRIFGGLQSTSIMAIAFFVLAGNLMTQGGISKRIVNFANCLVGNVRGGMSLALVLACAFFAALSGSAPATVIAIGTMLYGDMVKLGYPGDRTAGLLVVSGGLGPIIPPSIIMVIYCTLTGASVGNMFKQGMMIGVAIMIVLMTEVIYFANKADLSMKVEVDELKKKTGCPVVVISAREETGIEDLEKIVERMFLNGEIEKDDEVMITNTRHKSALESAFQSIKMVLQGVESGVPEDFLTIDLMEAYGKLGTIIGEAVGEDLVNEIFERFCMGK